ncbi:hypothetical protein [Rhizobium sp. ZX09]|uniref:hypothetical protein n=1 Tax=Rhizobium sp. ZX09 TaxID=2291939 RepID=UPI001A99FA60|nr:hypothetical protein [Rhizobium sp. ZX09]QSZ57717.1 hypothetical protein BTN45_11840 [Rhizobium sp. ZX09]
MSRAKRLILFPDSNLFFQCRALGELPWKELGDYDEVELIVSRPVQKEIDRHKGGGNDRRQRRARQIASLLREVIKNKLAPQDICDGPPEVKLTLRVDLKPDVGLTDKLNYAEPDDTLVGIAHGFAGGVVDADVAVLTDDTGVMASTEAVSLTCIAIPDEWRLEPEATKESKELKAAQAEIARLQKHEPTFNAEFFDSNGRPALSLDYEFARASALTRQEIRALLDQARLVFPLQTNFAPQSIPVRGPRGISLESLRGMRSPPNEQQIAEYNAAYEAWLSKLETALGKIHLKLLQDKTESNFSFVAQNSGTRPANDVLVEIVAKGPLLISRPPDKDDENEDNYPLPVPPAVPEFQFSALGSMFRVSNMFGPGYGIERELRPLVDPYFHRGRDAEGFYYKGGHRKIAGDSLRLECALWRHGREPESFHAVIETDANKDAKGIVEFRIHASNLSNVVSCRIPVRITFKAFSTYKYASQLIDALTPAKGEGS